MDIKKILSGEKLPVVLHIMAWIIILVVPVYLESIFGSGNKVFLMHMYVSLLIYGCLFYLNYLWLMPKYFFKPNRIQYFIIAIVLVIVVCALLWIINESLIFRDPPPDIEQTGVGDVNQQMRRPPNRIFKLFDYFYTSVLVLGFSLGLRLLKKESKDEKERKELEKEKLNSELAFLKNQISPHFFFNTLNNIYSLINIDTENAGESVLKLSKLMRYLLYESEKGQTKLSEEINFLNNYIDLMRLRLTNKVDVSVSFPEKYKDITIPPLLFVAFIENAFKHGVSARESSFITMTMELTEEYLHFSVRNSISSRNMSVDGQYSGIGLENVKKRLNLLFPSTHRLEIETTEDEFLVNMLLELQ